MLKHAYGVFDFTTCINVFIGWLVCPLALSLSLPTASMMEFWKERCFWSLGNSHVWFLESLLNYLAVDK